MTDRERIEKLQRVVATLISCLHRELGTHAATKLLQDLHSERSKRDTIPTDSDMR